MEKQRTILWVLFAAMVFLTWTKWQEDNKPVASVAPPTVEPANQSLTNEVALPPAPQVAGGTKTLPALMPNDDAAQQPASTAAVISDERVTIETDVLRLQISKTGGTLLSAELKEYPKNKDQPDLPVTLLNADISDPYLLISGLVDSSRSGPTHLAVLSTDADSYILKDSSDNIEIPFRWSANGVNVEKIYRLQRGLYNIDVEYRVRNNSSEPWRALSYMQIRKLHNPPERSMFNVDSYSFNGPVIYDGDKYEKLDPEDFEDEPVDSNITGGWIASIEHHFLTAAIPPAADEYTYDATFKNGIATVRANGPTTVVAPGAEAVITEAFFVGPKLQDQLEATAPGLSLTVDYGILAILAQPLFWLLQQVHKILGNWGWTIICVTFLIKLAFYKLTETSGRSMAKMRKLQPRLKALQERYKDDRPALSQNMMELYKREKVNPAAGCLPMLVQIPFFIAFYWVLLESVEMRQAPFILWITDLSSRDPYFVLPLLMGIAMFVQQKLNPAPPDPIQAKVMTILPVMFTGFFAFFPSGLVLYWLTNSVLSVLQQWNINRKMAVD